MPHVSEKFSDHQIDLPTRQVRLFCNGANQAVRIPKEFELPGKDALMRREGNKLVIGAVEPKHPKGSTAALMAALESIKAGSPSPNHFWMWMPACCRWTTSFCEQAFPAGHKHHFRHDA